MAKANGPLRYKKRTIKPLAFHILVASLIPCRFSPYGVVPVVAFQNPFNFQTTNSLFHDDIVVLYSSPKPSYEFESKQPSVVQPPRQEWKPKESPVVTRNKKIIALGKNRKWKEILSLYGEESNEFNNVNYATAMMQFGRIRSIHRNDPSFVQFVQEMSNAVEEKGLDWIGIMGIANIVHAIGKMSLKSEASKQIMSFVLKEEVTKAIFAKGKPQDIANICWSIAKQRVYIYHCMSFLREIENCASWLVREGKPQEVTNIAWAFATLGFSSPNFFAEIERNSAWLVQEGNAQDVANTAWACSKLGLSSPQLFSEIEKHAPWLVKEGTPQAVANTALACATLGHKSPNLFSEIETRSAWLVEEGSAQAVANTAWACGKLGVWSPRFFFEIDKRSSSLVKTGNPQNVANIAWACAKSSILLPNLFAEIDNSSAWLVEEGSSQAIENTAWAFETLGQPMPRSLTWKIIKDEMPEL